MSVTHPPEEDSYFVSMTDMMVGMLFVFILLLLTLALQSREEAEAAEAIVEERADRDEARRAVLGELQTAFEALGVTVHVLPEEGVLRLPENVLFERGGAEPGPQGRAALGKLAEALIRVVPCHAGGAAGADRTDCETSQHGVEALMIEGHTDDSPFRSGVAYDNLDLSLDRAANVYRIVTANEPLLADLLSPAGEPILSVSGYADQRPIDLSGTPAGDERNRRIDLRLIMAPGEVIPSRISEGVSVPSETTP